MIPSVHGVVEDVNENGPSPKKRCLGLVDVNAEQVDELGSFALDERADLGLEVGTGVVDRSFKVVDHDIRLPSAQSTSTPHLCVDMLQAPHHRPRDMVR